MGPLTINLTTMRRALLLPVLAGLLAGCSLFETRQPEAPTQSGNSLPAPTTPAVVLSNLQIAIISRDLNAYMDCFANPAITSRGFTFVPSPDYIVQLQPWSYTKEHDFMNDLISKARPSGFSNLLLTPRDSLISSDSVDYRYIYTFVFETRPEYNFTSRAHGSLEFKIGLEDDRVRWSIYYWADNPENRGDTTWSAFKQKF